MADQTPTTDTTATQTTPADGAIPETWEAYLEKQDEKVKALYTAHRSGLLNAVKATRDERDDLARQIKTLAKAQAEGSEAKTQLEAITAQLEKTERRAAFLEEAMKPELQCRNPKAAWLLAEAGNHFDKKGNVDFAALRAEAPELFGLPTARANAGSGTQTPPSPTQSMNDFIRTSAGRGN